MKRPIGITILAVLYFLSGLAILGMQVAFYRQLNEGLGNVGVSAVVAQLGILFLAALGLAAGTGMWLAKRWGWWLGAFYLTYSVARSINALIALPGLLEAVGGSAGSGAKYYIKYGGRVVIHSLICWYFFTPKVEAYFGVADISRKKRVGGLVAATAGVGAVFFLLNTIR